jgi:hypothetical protein
MFVIPLLVPALAVSLGARHSPGDDPKGGSGYGVSGNGFQRGAVAGVQLRDSSIVLKGTGLRDKPTGYRVKRPCWYEPGKTAEDMLKAQESVRAFWFHNQSGATAEDFERFLKQFKDKIGQDGRWWSPAYNAADPDGFSCWNDLEGALWVPTGTTPPGGITREELLQIARAALTVPQPKIKLSPATRSYVNLPTWVWLPGAAPASRSVTATIPGVMSATVTARLAGIEIDPGTTDDRAEVRRQCGTAGHPYQKGVTFKCGIRYLRASGDQPRKSYALTVTTVWPVTSDADQTVVPTAFEPVRASVTREVPVGEVQSTVRTIGE